MTEFLISRRHDEQVQLYAFDILALDGEDLRGLALSMRKISLARLLARHPVGIFAAPFEHGEIGPDLFKAACDMALEGMVSKRAAPIALAGRKTGSRSRTASIRLIGGCRINSKRGYASAASAYRRGGSQ